MSKTGEVVALKIKKSIPFFDEIDNFCGNRDSCDPGNSHIVSAYKSAIAQTNAEHETPDDEQSLDQSDLHGSSNEPDVDGSLKPDSQIVVNKEAASGSGQKSKKKRKSNTDLMEESLAFQRKVVSGAFDILSDTFILL